MPDLRLPTRLGEFKPVAVVVYLVGMTFFALFSTREAALLFAAVMGAALLAALLIHASHRDGEP